MLPFDSPERPYFEAVPGLTGLENLVLMKAGKTPMGETLKFGLVEFEKGRVVFEATPGRHAFNPHGAAHGGYAASILDSACGSAIYSMCSAAVGHVTAELKVAYHRPITEETGRLRAEGKVVTFGRKIGFAEATLKDAQGRLYASATSTLVLYAK